LSPAVFAALIIALTLSQDGAELVAVTAPKRI
jgi:hypothetical protein